MVYRQYEVVRENLDPLFAMVGSLDGTTLKIQHDSISLKPVNEPEITIFLNNESLTWIADALKSAIRSDGYAYGSNSILIASFMSVSGNRRFNIDMSNGIADGCIELDLDGIYRVVYAIDREMR